MLNLGNFRLFHPPYLVSALIFMMITMMIIRWRLNRRSSPKQKTLHPIENTSKQTNHWMFFCFLFSSPNPEFECLFVFRALTVQSQIIMRAVVFRSKTLPNYAKIPSINHDRWVLTVIVQKNNEKKSSKLWSLRVFFVR